MEQDIFDRDLVHTLVPMVEAMLFVADEPLDAATLAGVIEAVRGYRPTKEQIESAVALLQARFSESGSILRVNRWAGGYRLATDESVSVVIRELFVDREPKRLSRSLMETLAVAAYRQPVTKPEIDFVRGVNSDYTIRRLLELDFLKVIGRSEAVGQPLLYGTSEQFLERFGLNDLDALPRLREVEELLNDPGFHEEQAELALLNRMQESADHTSENNRQHEGAQSEG